MTHVFSADSFNENKPSSFDPGYMRDVAAAIYSGCSQVDPDCVWLVKAWAFYNSQWPPSAVQGFMSGVPIGKLLVLDLFAETVGPPLFENLSILSIPSTRISTVTPGSGVFCTISAAFCKCAEALV